MSVAVIAQHLDTTQRRRLAVELSQDLETDSVKTIGVVCDLLGDDLNEEVDANFFKYTDQVLDRGGNYGGLIALAARVRGVNKRVVLRMCTELRAFLSTADLIPLVAAMRKQDGKSEYEIDQVLDRFEFLNEFLAQGGADSDLEDILCLCMGSTDERVSGGAARLVRWRTESLAARAEETFVWDVIFAMQRGTSAHRTHAYVLWLRYLGHGAAARADFAQVVREPSYDYWTSLQHGLVSSRHDHRKYCLSILQVSVQNMRESVETPVFSWDESKSDAYTTAWARFVTLYEIVAVDTSLHQAQGAVDDIVALVAPGLLIDPSWGYCLLSTGFCAGMDSVRRFAMSAVLSIPPAHLYLMKSSLDLLELTFLPYMMAAMHFAVRRADETNAMRCQYGPTLARFVRGLVQGEGEAAVAAAAAVLRVLVARRDSFDPARIYVVHGLIQGLAGRAVYRFAAHAPLLLSLCEVSCEGPVLEQTCQTLHLRLLLCFEYDRDGFVDFLCQYVQFNGVKYIDENMLLLVEYLKKNNASRESFEEATKTEDDDVAAMAARIACELGTGPWKFGSTTRTAKALAVGATVADAEFVSKIVAGTEPTAAFEAAARIDLVRAGLPSVDLSSLWTAVRADVESADVRVLDRCVVRWATFNNFFNQHPHNIDITAVVELYPHILSNAGQLARDVKDFYKLRDEVFAQYFRTMAIVISRAPVPSDQILAVLAALDTSSAHYELNLNVAKVLNSIIYQDLDRKLVLAVVETTKSLWDNVCSARLQLNQKDLHMLIIDTMTQSQVLAQSVDDSTVAAVVEDFCRAVVQNSAGRRCLLPKLTRQLSQFQIENDAFENMPWLPLVLVQAFTVFQLRNNTFRLDNIVAKLYDQEIGPSGDLYAESYGDEEISARVHLMAIFNSVTGPTLAVRLVDEIFDATPNICTVHRSTDGLEEWTRVQLCCILVSVFDRVAADAAAGYVDRLRALLATEPSPLCRVYFEWVLALHGRTSPTAVHDMIDRFRAGVHANTLKPAEVVAYERAIFLAVQRLEGSTADRSRAMAAFLAVLLAGGTTNKASIRHFSLSLILLIYPEINRQNLDVGPDVLQMVETLYRSATKSDAYGTYRSGDALLWDVCGDLTLVGISGGVLLRVSDRDIDFILRRDYDRYLLPAQAARLVRPAGDDLPQLWVRALKTQHQIGDLAAKTSTQLPLQTKSGAWTAVMEDTKSTVVRSDLIVVASLVDKPPNLGGICRLCDVLGAGTLTLNDIKAKEHPQFKNVAVTADLWMPMVEVVEDDILAYLRARKSEGYTLIGLEQTDQSVELNSELKFPKKSLVLLGKEKEGIPGHLLAELDLCVEIKQVGVIRSMNIQTATAIIVHAYSSQHC